MPQSTSATFSRVERARPGERHAVAWLLGGQCLSLADYVTVTAPTGEAVAAGCC